MASAEDGAKILIADDESDIRALLKIVLSKDGHEILEACNGEEAVEAAKSTPGISLYILDIMMPLKTGLDAAGEIRKISRAPILFLTAKSADRDKIRAYAAGADDYIVKPFYPTDLRLKVQALIRRFRMQLETENSGEELLSLPSGILLDTAKKTVSKNGEPIPLTGREYDLLFHLVSHRGMTFSPADLYEAVWGEAFLSTSSNTVMVHIANLRRKLEDDPQNPVLVRTVWGKGYRFDS